MLSAIVSKSKRIRSHTSVFIQLMLNNKSSSGHLCMRGALLFLWVPRDGLVCCVKIASEIGCRLEAALVRDNECSW